jgi:hypothetical protein
MSTLSEDLFLNEFTSLVQKSVPKKETLGAKSILDIESKEKKEFSDFEKMIEQARVTAKQELIQSIKNAPVRTRWQSVLESRKLETEKQARIDEAVEARVLDVISTKLIENLKNCFKMTWFGHDPIQVLVFTPQWGAELDQFKDNLLNLKYFSIHYSKENFSEILKTEFYINFFTHLTSKNMFFNSRKEWNVESEVIEFLDKIGVLESLFEKAANTKMALWQLKQIKLSDATPAAVSVKFNELMSKYESEPDAAPARKFKC